MESFSSTDGWYEGRPVASGSISLNPCSAKSSPSTKTSTARTGLSSQIQSSRHSGNSVLCPRSTPSTKRLISFSRESHRENRIARRFHRARVKTRIPLFGAYVSFQARGHASGAVEQVRVGHQCRNRQDSWLNRA